MTETHTGFETSKLMHDALLMETGMWWYDKHNSRGIIHEIEKKDKMPVFSFYPAHTLATAIQWLDKYLDPFECADIYAREKKHALLDAFIAGKHDMSSPEVNDILTKITQLQEEIRGN